MLVALVMVHAYHACRWDFILFLSGMVLAELDQIRGAHDPPSALPSYSAAQAKQSKRWTTFWWCAAFVAVCLMNQPDFHGATTPGWRTLVKAIPKWWDEPEHRFYQGPGAVLFVAATARLPALRKFFELPLIQYLGKISFSLYLMHGLEIHTFGYMYDEFIFKNVTGIKGNMFHVGFVITWMLSLPTVIWMSDSFWRAFDIPSVTFGKWLEGHVNAKLN